MFFERTKICEILMQKTQIMQIVKGMCTCMTQKFEKHAKHYPETHSLMNLIN